VEKKAEATRRKVYKDLEGVEEPPSGDGGPPQVPTQLEPGAIVTDEILQRLGGK